MIEIKITARDLKTNQIKIIEHNLPDGSTFNTGILLKNYELLNDTEYEVIEQEVRGA